MGENVGIDVAKERLEVALLPSGKEFCERNDAGAIKRLVKRLETLGCERVVLEASGGGATLVSRLPELGRLNRAEVAALAGVAPFNRDSGTLRGRRMIHGSRARLRTVLYCATVAAIRKLLVILNAMVKTRTAWSPPCPA